MSLQFILGRAGVGKTYHCLEAVRTAALAAPEGPPLILLVPEQATFQMEQALLGGDLKGMIRAQVLSFQRLAWRVSLKAGGLAAPPLSDLGKRMVLRSLLERRTDELQIFGKVADRPGFVEKLAGTISELRVYRRSPSDLKAQLDAMRAAGSGESPLAAKLHDLSLVMQDLTDYTAGRFTDPDDYLPVAADRLAGSGLLDGAQVWLDSFSGFTPQELTVLAAILQSAQQVHMTLCLDPAELRQRSRRRRHEHDFAELFDPTLTTYDQLTTLAGECGVAIVPPVVLGLAAAESGDAEGAVTAPRFRNAPDLAYAERHLFDRGVAEPYTGRLDGVALLCAQNRRQEVEAAAREVLRLVRDCGFRYREISVVARNLDAYGDLAATVFGEHGLPVFVDRRRTVAHHSLVELVRAALEVVIHDWAYAPVFRFLKTDLAPVFRHEVDTLENYVIEHGIRGRRWHDTQPWAYLRRYTLEDDTEPSRADYALLERINGIRERAVGALATFQRRLGGGRGAKNLTVRSVTAALYQLLDDLGVAKTLERWSADAEAAGDLAGSREHEQVWDGLIDLLDQIVEALGETPATLPQYLHILSAGLEGLRLGLIPPGLDQIVVGTAERSRHSGVRATLILGATEKDFPPLPPEDAIFNDQERETLDEGGLEIGPTSLMRLFQEQFFTYVALTRGSERLWISYPAGDDDGRAVAPSPVIRRLEQLFPELERTPVGDLPADPLAALDFMATPAHFAAVLTRTLRAHRAGYALNPIWLDLYQWAATNPALQDHVRPVIAALKYEESFQQQTAPLGSDLALALYGSPLITSVSRLESFLACPFEHFAKYGLRLKERARFEVAAPELGLFYHAVLSLFVRTLKEQGRTWESLTAGEADAIIDDLIQQLAPKLQNEILLSDAQHRYVLRVMGRTLHSSLRFLGEHIHGGQFRPLQVELPFGEDPAGLAPVDMSVPGGPEILLRGRIDRVDGLQLPDGTWYLRVMDYKSGPKNLNLGRFYYGLALQLLLYLYTVVNQSDHLVGVQAHPAGALYFPIHDPVERLILPQTAEEMEKRRRKLYRANGIVVAEPAVVQAMDLEKLGLTQVRLSKDGLPYKNAPVATEEQFRQLFGHLKQTVQGAATSLMNGEVGVTPYKLPGPGPCYVCPFRAVCQFDPLVKHQGYRNLVPLKGPEVWAKLAEKGGNDHE